MIDEATILAEALPSGALERLDGYLDGIGALMKDKRQRASLALYVGGLLSDGDRKSMEPMAARAVGDPGRTNAVHQRMIHFLATDKWRDLPIRKYATQYAIDAMQEVERIHTWIVDDTGFLKQGKHSPGVQRQYTGSAGKTTNCQIGVSLVLANSHAHVPVDFRLYIPVSWAQDPTRCKKAYIPTDVTYAPKWRLALDMIATACNNGVPKGVVLADADYGNKSAFRGTLDVLNLQYAVDVHSTTKVRLASEGEGSERLSVLEIGRRLHSKLRTVKWREGTRRTLASRFVRTRVIVDRNRGRAPRTQWLVVEWPEDEKEPTKFVLSTLPDDVTLKQLVRTFKDRWRIERTYQDLKGDLGLDHYEGRSFIGWHHHITAVLACAAFLVAEQVRSFPPSCRGAAAPRSLLRAA